MTTARARRGSPRIRLIWDELLSHRVAQALRVLGFQVTWVGSGDLDAPVRGSTDAAVIEFALTRNQFIVTSNHDMMMLCDEAGQRFVWLDPYGRPLRREDQVLLAFKQIAEWERIFNEQPDMCVVARRSGCKAIASAEAARLAHNRMRSLERKRRRRARSQTPSSGSVPIEGL